MIESFFACIGVVAVLLTVAGLLVPLVLRYRRPNRKRVATGKPPVVCVTGAASGMSPGYR